MRPGKLTMASRQFSCTVDCPRCTKTYKNSKSAVEHRLKSHQLTSHLNAIEFRDNNSVLVDFPKPEILPSDCAQYERYKEWLASLRERLNEALHPALPGKYAYKAITHLKYRYTWTNHITLR